MAAERIVLVVDDDSDVVEAIRLHLSRKGYQVFSAPDGEEGLRRAHDLKPGLILLDVNMPKKGGIEFYTDITGADGKKLFPVIVLTGRREFEVFFKGLDADGFVSKPIDHKKLGDLVDQIFAKYQTKAVKQAAHSVCVVEDDDAETERLVMAFVRSGFSVRCAKTAGELAAQSFGEPLDLLLIKLPLCDVVAGLWKIPNLMKFTTAVIFYAVEESNLDKGIAERLCQESRVKLAGLVESRKAADVLSRAKETLGLK